MPGYPTLYVTQRGLRHQQDALAAAPPELDVVVVRSLLAEDPQLATGGRPDSAAKTPEAAALGRYLAEAVFLISERSGLIDAATIAAAPHLRMILRLGSLVYDIDLPAARRAGVVVSAWPIRPVIMVAEHAMMQMLALAKRLREVETAALSAGNWGPSRRTDENVFAFNWSGRTGIEGLWQKTVGILGFGEIGAEVARRLAGWGCRILYNRRHRLPDAEEDRLGIVYAPREELLAASDFLLNLLPYYPETDHALGAAEFAAMKPGAHVASCGSGSVIDEAALAAAVRSGQLGGAALDTYEFEPLTADNALRLLATENPAANVLLTPHTAAAVPPDTIRALRGEEYTPILQFLRGEPLRYRVA